MNASAVSDAIAELFARNKIRTKDVALNVSGNTVIIRKMTLPLMTQDELSESIQWEAENYIPFDINDVYLGYEVVARRTEQNLMDVVLAAAKREVVDDYQNVCLDAGCTPRVVDVDAFALQNAYEVNYGFNPGETVVLLDIGNSVVTMNVVSDGVTMFTRDLNVGGAVITEEIQRQLNITYEEAELYKMGDAGGGDQVMPREVERVIGQKAEEIATDIQRSLDFFAATATGTSIKRIVVSGGTSAIPSLVRTLERISQIPAEVMNPFRQVSYDERSMSTARAAQMGPMASVALGLALRRTNES